MSEQLLYIWDYEASTDKVIDARSILDTGKTIQQICNDVELKTRETLLSEFVKEALIQKLNFSIKSLDVRSGYITIQRNVLDYQETEPPFTKHYIVIDELSLWVKFQLSFISDKPLMTSPLELATAMLIKHLITVIFTAIIAIVGVYALAQWLTSMTTKKTIIEEYRIIYNPDGTVKEEIFTKKETTEPDPFGSGIVWIAIIIMAFMFLSLGASKK